MHVECHKWRSSNLDKDMELRIYGYAGKPLIIFPCAGGRFYESEDFGMVEALRRFIDAGKLRLYAVDSVDSESWLARWLWPGDRAWRHEQYDRYLVKEVIPFIREFSDYRQKFMVTGSSMGGYHAANFFFRHPDIFDTVIAMSGLYGPDYFVGDYNDKHVYYNFPLLYLPHLKDNWYLDQYRKSVIIVCVGQGAWEDLHVAETQALEGVLKSLDVPAWVDYWGHDVTHDWLWWKKQLPYFLNKLEL